MFRFSGFTQKANNAINLSINQASALGHTYIGSEHLVLGLLEEGSGVASCALSQRQISLEKYKQLLIKAVGRGAQSDLTPEDFTPRCRHILEVATIEARALGQSSVGTEHILIAILKESDSYALRFLKELGLDPDQTCRLLSESIGTEPQQPNDIFSPRTATARPPVKTQRPTGKTTLLDRYSRDLTELAKLDRLDPVIGRETEIERVIRILSRRTKNNPCLIGEAGVGKTAIAEGLAQRIAAGQVPEGLRNRRLLSLDLTGMVAGTKYRGDFEERIKNIIDGVISAGNIVVFIDEIHTLIGTGAAEGAIDASNILKPQLARGELQVVGATTIEEYRKFIEKDAALDRRFQSIIVDEPSQKTSVEILKGLRQKYENHHKIRISDEAIDSAVELSIRYLPEKYLPDKAIDLLDEASACVRLKNYTAPTAMREQEDKLKSFHDELELAINSQDFETAAKVRDMEKDAKEKLTKMRREWQKQNSRMGVQVTAQDVAAIVSQATGIDVTTLTEEQSVRLLKLEELLHKQVVGQEKAVSAVARSIRRSRVGLGDPNRPIGSFIFLGPTGVGKTQLCKALAFALFGNENALIRLDMSEYMEKHSVSRLTGSPPGYVGYDEGGQLTERVRRKPYSVILFDEIEKAHPDLFNILLQITEDGHLTDSQGRKVSFKNTVIIITSNVGARFLTDKKSLGFGESTAAKEETIKHEIMQELKNLFRPEFLNRIDEIIIFEKLSKEDLEKIAEILLNLVAERLKQIGVSIEFAASVKENIAKEGYDTVYGARPLRRAVQTKIEDKIAGDLLTGDIKKGDKLLADWQSDGLKLMKN